MVLIVAGGLLLMDVAVTALWQEPLSALYAHFQQEALVAELAARQPLTALQLRRLERLRTERRRIAFLAGVLARRARRGQPIGRLRIPRIGIDFVVVQGTDGTSLRRGPGHYPDTPMPGRRGTVAIAGHRTTWLAPFRGLDRMRNGDPIVVETPYGRFLYRTEHLAQGVSVRPAAGGIRPARAHRLPSDLQRPPAHRRVRPAALGPAPRARPGRGSPVAARDCLRERRTRPATAPRTTPLTSGHGSAGSDDDGYLGDRHRGRRGPWEECLSRPAGRPCARVPPSSPRAWSRPPTDTGS